MTRKRSAEDVVSQATAAVQKRFAGKIPTRTAADDLVLPSVWASTGSLVLDRAIAGKIPGGVPMGPHRGRVVHIFSDPSLGKSLLADQVAKAVEDLGGVTLVSETEGSRDPHFPQAIGLNLKRVTIQRPATIEELFDGGLEWIAEVRKVEPDILILWIWDSVELTEAERTAKERMSGSGAFQYGGGRSQAIGAGCRKVAVECGRHPTTFLILNQVRENVGVMFGAAKKPPGGLAPRFFASTELQLMSSKLGKRIENGLVVGRWVHAKVVKNKLSEPFAECDFYIDFRKGVHRWAGVMEQLETERVITDIAREKSGKITGKTFVVVATGEELPLEHFTAWCEQAGVLTKHGGRADG